MKGILFADVVDKLIPQCFILRKMGLVQILNNLTDRNALVSQFLKEPVDIQGPERMTVACQYCLLRPILVKEARLYIHFPFWISADLPHFVLI